MLTSVTCTCTFNVVYVVYIYIYIIDWKNEKEVNLMVPSSLHSHTSCWDIKHVC